VEGNKNVPLAFPHFRTEEKRERGKKRKGKGVGGASLRRPSRAVRGGHRKNSKREKKKQSETPFSFRSAKKKRGEEEKGEGEGQKKRALTFHLVGKEKEGGRNLEKKKGKKKTSDLTFMLFGEKGGERARGEA